MIIAIIRKLRKYYLNVLTLGRHEALIVHPYFAPSHQKLKTNENINNLNDVLTVVSPVNSF